MIYERKNMPPDTFDNVVYRPIGNNDTTNQEQRLRAWLMRGSIREDDLLQTSYKPDEEPNPPDIDPHGEFMRVYHHFYDPVHQIPLTMPFGLSCDSLSLPGLIPGGCALAIDWALGQQDALDAANQTEDSGRRNHFSWVDARAAQWCALTAKHDDSASWSEDSGLRRLCWATSLKSLGAALHLLQDMAQPQHVRNDRHNPPIDEWYSLLVQTDAERRSYEIYTNWRATAGLDISAPEEEKVTFKTLFGETITAPAIATTLYPIPRLELPIEYYTTRHIEAGDIHARRGMADFTNRNFFSEGTILSSEYPQPPADLSDASYQINDSVEEIFGVGIMTKREITRIANDSLNPGFADPVLAPLSGRLPLATQSIWCNDEVVMSGICLTTATIGLDQYRVQADVLIPRAVAYSAGLIDYFFRGRLEVNAPADGGLLAAIDQGTPHSTVAGYPRRSDNGEVFGFTKIRLGVRNTTRLNPADVETVTNQPLGAGELVAIARYHRNPCYQPDLRSEWVINFDSGQSLVPSGTCTLDQLRTAYEEISVSAPLAALPDLNGGSAETVVFDFSDDPIPLNVTDLYFQVAFRGELGMEKEGIAVGRWDAPEPRYLVWHNASDMHVSNYSYQASTPPPAVGYNRTDNQTVASATWNMTQPVFHISGALPVKRFVRIAVIGPKTAAQLDTTRNFQFGPYIDPGSYFVGLSFDYPRQANKETIAAGVYDPAKFASRRGTTFNLWIPAFKNDGTEQPNYSLLPPLSPAEQIAMPGIVVIDSDL